MQLNKSPSKRLVGRSGKEAGGKRNGNDRYPIEPVSELGILRKAKPLREGVVNKSWAPYGVQISPSTRGNPYVPRAKKENATGPSRSWDHP